MRTKMVVLFILLFQLISCQDFSTYGKKFSKMYNDESERNYREQLYLKKWAYINKTNSMNLGYTLGQSQFTDRTQQQASQMGGLRQIPQLPIMAIQSNLTLVRSISNASNLPIEVDWRALGKVSSIKNQGVCGACWVFAATAIYESILMLGGMSQPDLSEEYILQCTAPAYPGYPASTCSGGYVDPAIQLAVWKGIPTERQYPYLAAKMTQGMPQTKGICSASPLVKDTVINGKFTNTNANLSNTEMKNLLSYAPIAVTLYVPPSFFDYSGGTYSGCPNFTTSVHNINHGVLIVGYDVNGNYVIKNSWGTSWGKNGFALISKDADCGMSHAPRYIRGNNLPLEYDPNQQLTIDFGEEYLLLSGIFVLGMIFFV